MERPPSLQVRWSSSLVVAVAWLGHACLLLQGVRASAEGGGQQQQVYRYNVCNGLSNQLLYHAASIALGSKKGQRVEVPNYFIVNGVQTSDASVLPSRSNSIPFGVAFDKDYFLQKLEVLHIEATFVEFDFTRSQIPCQGMAVVEKADPRLTQSILDAFAPSAQLSTLIQSVTNAFEAKGLGEGICVHHRNGQDWHDHCSRWSAIPDGVYRGNCLEVAGRTFVESLEDRGLTDSRWVYYCGDHAVPKELDAFTVITKETIMPEKDRKAVQALHPGEELRDLWALIDFFACHKIDNFIGNSVSTFSALQIALRDGTGAYWYNSQSIPLAGMWRVYQMPIVYTYTELSMSTGKHLLQSSIVSVRQFMPNNVIHVLYHGTEDNDFRVWLQEKNNVVVHDHDPSWRGKVEEMRRNGDPAASHLFLHAGNYFGTWQRIDIPLFVQSEYCLLLDADTVIKKPFTIDDFGLDLTKGIAMSSELYAEDTTPSNAGVTLMNVPHLRQTYQTFLKFILAHVETAKFDHPSPSDQGAYLVFYKDDTQFLSRLFNFKPYWKLDEREFHRVFIVHFHGPKPHDYMRFIMGKGCNQAVKDLCRAAITLPFICRSLHYFARASRRVDEKSYCEASFDSKNQVYFCDKLFDRLASEEGRQCHDFPSLVWDTLESVPSSLKLPREVIRKKLKIPFSRTRASFGRLYIGSAMAGFAVLAVLCSVMDRLQAMAIFLFLWVVATLMISHLYLQVEKGPRGIK